MKNPGTTKVNNPGGKMTYQQSWTLFTFTSKDWRNLGNPPDRGKASVIIGYCIQYFVNKANVKEQLETAVREYFPGWSVTDRKWNSYKKGQTTPRGQASRTGKDNYGHSHDYSTQESSSSNSGDAKTQEGLPGMNQQEGQGQGQEGSEGKGEGQENGEGKGESQENGEGKGESQEGESQEGEGKEGEGQGEGKKEEDGEDGEGQESNNPTDEPEENNPSDSRYIKPPVYQLVKKMVNLKLNTYLQGPAGCGKSRMIEEIAKDLKREFFTISFAGGLRYAQVFGSTQITDGVTAWKPGPLLEAIQRPCVILLDELPSADPDVLLGLNSMLEPNSRRVLTPIGEIKVNPDCALVAASNTTGRTLSRQYTGVQRADDSLLDRFGMVLMDYDEKLEKRLIYAMLGEEKGNSLFVKLVNLRHQIKANSIAFDPSTRRLLHCGKLLKAGISLKDSWNVAFLNSLSKNEREKVNG